MLTVRRDGVKTSLTLLATYGPAPQETVFGWQRRNDDSWDYRLDGQKKIGYLRISVFGRDTAKDLEKALDELATQGVRGVVLDLRFCPGGFLGCSTRMAEQFLDKGDLIVKTRYAQEDDDVYRCDKATKRTGLKLVCLVNGDTARAAELFVAALQDHHRAIVVGQRSHGNGSVQNIEYVNYYDLKCTVALFLRPSGKKLDRMKIPGYDADEWGVTPDTGNVVQLEQKEQDALKEHLERRSYLYRRDDPARKSTEFKDRQLQRALEVLGR